MTRAHFGPGLFRFLRDLAAHNDRAWFQAQRERFEADVRGPLLSFIEDLAPGLRKISPRFVADPRPVGGSMFRLHRDTRFAKDKSPYKTHAAAQFRHEAGARDVHAPGFYLHLEPGRSLGGGGLWRPDPPALKLVRDRIAGRPRDWQAALEAGGALEGDTLRRVPAGYDPGHRFADDLKRKDYYTLTRFSDEEVCSADFMKRHLEACRKAAPLVAFLTKALELRW